MSGWRRSRGSSTKTDSSGLGAVTPGDGCLHDGGMAEHPVVVPEESESIAGHARALGASAPAVQRIGTSDDPRSLSGLRWGSEPPRWLFVHGGMQNAHTWNSVLLRAGFPALALDMPGHGRSARFDDGRYTIERMADALASSLAGLREPVTVVGHSLGAMVSLRMVAQSPGVARALVLVDAEPGGFGASRPDSVPAMEPVGTFQELLEMGARRTGRRPDDVRRGVLMNSRPRSDGLWEGRWDPRIRSSGTDVFAESQQLWRDLEGLEVPVTLVRGSRSPFITPERAARFPERMPQASIAVAPDAGHNVQSDAAAWLAEWLSSRVFMQWSSA